MEEIVFIIKESPEGGFEANALEHSIFTEGDDIEQLKQNVREAVHCHFEKDVPAFIKLQFVTEEIIEA